jgi:hypothetical protein
VQSPSWAANWSAASQEIPRISRNPKVHYRTHKPPPTVPTLGQPNPVHYPHPTSWRFILIYTSTPRSPQWSLSPRFPHQDPVQPPLLTHTRHMPSPSQLFSILSPVQFFGTLQNQISRFPTPFHLMTETQSVYADLSYVRNTIRWKMSRNQDPIPVFTFCT